MQTNIKQDMKYIGAKVSLEIFDRLKARSEVDRRSMAKIIVLALEQYLK